MRKQTFCTLVVQMTSTDRRVCEEQFEKNKGRDLRVKWIEEKNDDHTEKEYIDWIAKKLGYWPEYNIRR